MKQMEIVQSFFFSRKPQTVNIKPQAVNIKPQTVNIKPQIVNIELHTVNINHIYIVNIKTQSYSI